MVRRATMVLFAVCSSNAVEIGAQATVGTGRIEARITPLGHPNILPQFQVRQCHAGCH